MSARVVKVDFESDEDGTECIITVRRDAVLSSPDVADVPADIQTALYSWLLTHYRQRFVSSVQNEPAPRGNEETVEPLEPFLPDGTPRCRYRVPGFSVQCAGTMQHGPHHYPA